MKEKTIQVVAAQEHVYNGQPYKPGDTYRAREEDVLILETHGRIQKVQQAEETTASNEPTKGKYKRRDIKAENDKA